MYLIKCIYKTKLEKPNQNKKNQKNKTPQKAKNNNKKPTHK